MKPLSSTCSCCLGWAPLLVLLCLQAPLSAAPSPTGASMAEKTSQDQAAQELSRTAERAHEEILRENQRYGVDVSAGISALNMDQFRKFIHYPGDTRGFYDAYFLAMDINYDFHHGMLAMGPRIKLIQATDYTLQGGPSPVYYNPSSKDTYRQSFLPVTFGVQYRSPTLVCLQAGLNVGYGFAGYQHDQVINGQTVSYRYDAACPTVESQLGVRFGRGHFHLGLDAGYRWAVVPRMNNSVDQGGALAGEGLKDSSTNDYVVFDYGGWSLGANISADY